MHRGYPPGWRFSPSIRAKCEWLPAIRRSVEGGGRRRPCTRPGNWRPRRRSHRPHGLTNLGFAITAGICARRMGLGVSLHVPSRSCPLWVKSGHDTLKPRCPLYPRNRTFVAAPWRWPPRQRNNGASSAYNDLRPPVWLGSAQGPFSPLWLPRPCSQKIRASVLLAPTCRHNKFPTARAFGESLAASRQTNSPLGQMLHSCVIKWRWAR